MAARSWLRLMRSGKNMTQEAAAKAIGINRTTLTKIELGTISPSLKAAKKIGKYYGFDWSAFFRDEKGGAQVE